VSSGVSAAEIQRAYRDRLQSLLVSANSQGPTLASRLTELHLAYETLGEKDKRETFDRGENDVDDKPHDHIIDHESTEADDGKRLVQSRRGVSGFEGPMEGRNWGSTRPVTRIGGQGRHRRWLVLLFLIVAAGGAWLNFRGPDQAAGTVSRGEAECVTSTWRTRITFDDSRLERASTTLRSRNRISSHDRKGCVDIAFACGSDGLYFEVLVESAGPQIDKKGLIVVEGIGDELNASIFGWRSDDGRSIRVLDKAVVEVLGSLLMDHDSFAVRLALSRGGDAVAHFDSSNLSAAIRPVLLACR
jgi:hypothetical protein